MIIRSISTGEIELSQWFRILLKEALVGIGIGVLLGMLGFVLTLLNLDPALASGPFITSVVDVVGLVIYFAWSSVLLFG